MTTITTLVTSTVTLGADGYATSLLVDGTGLIKPDERGADGVYGGAGLTGVELVNQNVIRGKFGAYNYNGGSGVDLKSVATLENAGTITAGDGGSLYLDAGGSGGIGVDLAAGGTLTNSGKIAGGAGGDAYYTFAGNGGAGVSIGAAGMVTNTGSIRGGDGGANRYFGQYGGRGGNGVTLAQGASLTNTGNIAGGHGGDGVYYYDAGLGVYVGGGTLVNAGTISGGGTYGDGQPQAAVGFGAAAGTLVVDPGAVFHGAVDGNADMADSLVFAGATAGTAAGIGSEFVNFGTMSIAAGADWTLTGSNTLGAGSILRDAGTLSVTGQFAVGGRSTILSGSVLALDKGATVQFDAAVFGAGTIEIGSGASVDATGVLGVASVMFLAGGGETLSVGSPHLMTSTLSGFGAHDVIDLAKLAATSAQVVDGTLMVIDGTTTVDRISLAGSYTSANFAVHSDLHGGTDISFVATPDALAAWTPVKPGV